MICQNCKRKMNEVDEFCGGCGSQLLAPVTSAPNSCPSCLNKMLPDQTHCKKCGSSRALFKEEEFTDASAAPSKYSKILGFILSIAGLGIVIYAFINYQTTAESLRLENNPGIGLTHVMSFPIGIVGLIVLIAGLFSIRDSGHKP